MTLMTLLSFALALAIAAAIPGPGVTAIVARALGCGFWGTLPMIIGLTLGDLIYLSCAIFGLAAIAKTFGTVFLVLKYLGGAYLLYLAVKLWRATPEEGLGATVSREASPWRGFLAGLLVTLSNPKTMVFYLAFLPTFLDLAAIDLTSYVELCLAVIAVLLVVISAYALAAAKARALFRRPKAVRAINRGAGAMMAGAAVAVVSR